MNDKFVGYVYVSELLTGLMNLMDGYDLRAIHIFDEFVGHV